MEERTMLENADGNSEKTLLETVPTGNADATILESSEIASRIASTALVHGTEIDGCCLETPIQVASGEADLWIGVRLQDQQKVVVKIYRWGVRPKDEIREKVKRISRRQVVELFSHGKLADGRHFEVLEYCRFGTLAVWAKKSLTPEQVRVALRELSEAVSALHEASILHRDLKPGNVLVRTEEPLDLVLTDFGISSIAEMSLHATNANRTAAYSAPEALTGVVSKASDWWSVGVIILELLTGKHPFDGLDERAVNFTLVTRGIEISKKIPADWQNLIKGLLTRDHEKRWGSEQVNQWFSGKKNIPVFYVSETELNGKRRSDRPYRFLNEDYFELADFAMALAVEWDEGVRRMNRGLIAKELQDGDLSSLVMDIGEDLKLSPDQKLMVALLALDPKLPLIWRGDVVNKDWLASHPEEAADILESKVPEWHERLRGEQWLKEIRTWRNKVLHRLSNSEVPYEKRLVDRLVVSSAEEIQEVALEVWNNYSGSSVADLHKLFQQKSWSNEDAILGISSLLFLLSPGASGSIYYFFVREHLDQ